MIASVLSILLSTSRAEREEACAARALAPDWFAGAEVAQARSTIRIKENFKAEIFIRRSPFVCVDAEEFCLPVATLVRFIFKRGFKRARCRLFHNGDDTQRSAAAAFDLHRKSDQKEVLRRELIEVGEVLECGHILLK